MSTKRSTRLLFSFFIVFLAGCHSGPRRHAYSLPVSALENCSKEFGIEGLSYLISEQGRITTRHFGKDQKGIVTGAARGILAHFTAPLLLDRMIRDSFLNGQDSVNGVLQIKDLISVPAEYYDTTTHQNDLPTNRMLGVIRQCKRAKADILVPRFSGELGLQTGDGTRVLFQNLLHLSDYIDRYYPEYFPPGNSIEDLFPGWYTRGLSVFLGWNILKFQGQTLLWYCCTEGPLTFLMIKFMEKKVFVAASYTGRSILSPLDLNRKDLLQSPLALALVKACCLPDPAGDIDYSKPAGLLYKDLEERNRSWANFIYQHELLAYARLYERTGRKTQAAALYTLQERLIKDSLLVKYENTPPLAEINYVSDNLKAVIPFRLKNAAKVRIFSGGQIKEVVTTADNAYQFDNVQLFVNDHAGEKNNSYRNTRLFQFNYGTTKVLGTDAVCAFGDPTDTSYIIETRLDWKKLSDKKPGAGRVLLANVFLGDCDLDENMRKSILSWTVNAGQDFSSVNNYGRIVLTRRSSGAAAAKEMYAHYTEHPPAIDGRIDEVWGKAAWSPILLPYQQAVSPTDHAGKFKALYDSQFLYFLFEITDNWKNRIGIVTADKCWIENAASGQLVWKMNGERTESFPSFTAQSSVFLPRGSYLLKYVSDRGNSYDKWYGRPPGNGIYGAAVYPAKE